jgi:adenosylmethionine---8-amino-7-oxononanoate aminotransferase
MSDLLHSDRSNIWHPFTPLRSEERPVLIESASGVMLRTADGREIIDAVSSWWVNLHGHSNPAIARAISEQAGKLEHVIFAGFTHEPAIELSRNLLSILPQNQSRIFFSDDGSTAVEVALKMSLQFWYQKGQRSKTIVAVDGAYHGDTFGSMSAGARGIFTDPFASRLFSVRHIPFPDGSNDNEILTQFEKICSLDDAGVFIYEPLIQGAAGMRTYSAELLDKLLALAEKREMICVADEVLTGFGRTGKLFASDYMTNKPDIIALSKGVTGGALPLGVTSCSRRISEAFMSDDLSKTFFHGHSYTANPIACAAANASFALLRSDQCMKDIRRIEARHRDFLTRIQAHQKIEKISALGTILSIELKTLSDTSYTNPLRKRIYEFFMERNILLRPLGNVIYVLPPYVISDKDLDSVYAAIQEFLEKL